MEDVDGINGRLARLLVAEHEINPFVQCGGDLRRFERLSMNVRE
jgi:hypothetical protein